MIRRVGVLVVLALGFTLGTQAIGWWAVPLVGLLGGALLRRPSVPSVMVAMLAALAWGGLLLGTGARAPTFDLYARRLAETLAIPAWGLVVATLVLPALLAGSAAALGRQLAQLAGPRDAADTGPAVRVPARR